MSKTNKTSEKDYLSALNKMSRAITTDLYLDDILNLIVTLTAGVMQVKICALWLLDEETQLLSIRATQAMSREYLKERVIKFGEGIVGAVALKKEAIAIENVMEDKKYKEKELAKKENLVSMLSVPMMVKEKVVGVINVYSVKERKFSKSDVDLLSAAANQAAVAIKNTELMVKTKVIQEELETRKKVERAKGLLMEKQELSEDEAYKLMRKTSMHKRVSMKEIADAIILSSELSGM